MTALATRPRGRPARTARPVEETRSVILEAALKLFSQRGFQGAAMRDIAALAGVEHSALRYHYSDKATLWRAALARLIVDMNAHMAAGWRATAACRRWTGSRPPCATTSATAPAIPSMPASWCRRPWASPTASPGSPTTSSDPSTGAWRAC
uniref:TetR family transcriptional regulator n=1 Tax=Phenylobacterium glaciei TaxID=2803784 RepID=A0A974SAM6_9CAUL|nr:TetR family transcriptional regulator [Phenylobacterium glaciei]